jgi:hypothetical protein
MKEPRGRAVRGWVLTLLLLGISLLVVIAWTVLSPVPRKTKGAQPTEISDRLEQESPAERAEIQPPPDTPVLTAPGRASLELPVVPAKAEPSPAIPPSADSTEEGALEKKSEAIENVRRRLVGWAVQMVDAGQVNAE